MLRLIDTEGRHVTPQSLSLHAGTHMKISCLRRLLRLIHLCSGACTACSAVCLILRFQALKARKEQDAIDRKQKEEDRKAAQIAAAKLKIEKESDVAAAAAARAKVLYVFC